MDNEGPLYWLCWTFTAQSYTQQSWVHLKIVTSIQWPCWDQPGSLWKREENFHPLSHPSRKALDPAKQISPVCSSYFASSDKSTSMPSFSTQHRIGSGEAGQWQPHSAPGLFLPCPGTPPPQHWWLQLTTGHRSVLWHNYDSLHWDSASVLGPKCGGMRFFKVSFHKYLLHSEKITGFNNECCIIASIYDNWDIIWQMKNHKLLLFI